jgi:hypothetical protein
MQLDIEVGLLAGVSLGITYERQVGHVIVIDLVLLRCVLSFGPEATERGLG